MHRFHDAVADAPDIERERDLPGYRGHRLVGRIRLENPTCEDEIIMPGFDFLAPMLVGTGDQLDGCHQCVAAQMTRNAGRMCVPPEALGEGMADIATNGGR